MSKSIYATVLGDDFYRLHPKIQERFGFDSSARKRAIGRGVMDRVWRGPIHTVPFLWIGTWRNIMFPEQGVNVPFTIENWAYVDDLGRETVTELRTFELKRTRRFDAYMVRDPLRNSVVDYQGTHQHLAVDLHLAVAENGGLRITSGAQRIHEGFLSFRYPMFFSGQASVFVWYDDAAELFRIEVDVRSKYWGPIFGFSGSFVVDWEDVDPENLPARIKPKRTESRV